MGVVFTAQIKQNEKEETKMKMNPREIDTAYLPEKEKCFPKDFAVNLFEVMPGQVYLELKLMNATMYPCPDCHSTDVEVRGSEERGSEVRDLPYLGRSLTWLLDAAELRCASCGRESFVPNFPGFLEKGERITVRLKEFAVFLAAAASCEGASRILREMGTEISGDTIARTVQSWKNEHSVIWMMACHAVPKPVKRMTDEMVEEYARSLAYFMEEEILCMDRNRRLSEMARLMKTVFTEGKTSPGWCKKGVEFRWKEMV